ncbi:hypothetical protein WAI453_007760 [Rhynchosporium graminicola]
MPKLQHVLRVQASCVFQKDCGNMSDTGSDSLLLDELEAAAAVEDLFDDEGSDGIEWPGKIVRHYLHLESANRNEAPSS